MNSFKGFLDDFKLDSISENYLANVKASYKNNEILESEAKFLYTIKHNIDNNILLEEKIINGQLIISVVNEAIRNQGPNKSSYFKVFRTPSKATAVDNCLRISLFGPEYESKHVHTDPNPLTNNEKQLLVNILMSKYIPNPKKHQEMDQYKIMVSLYNQEKEQFYNDPKNEYTKIKYPSDPTVWIAILHYFNFVNNYKFTVSLLQLMPDYTKLPATY